MSNQNLIFFCLFLGTTNFVQDGSNDKIVYATFTTPDNSLAGSAICSFKLSDIRKAFDEGHFKGQVSRYVFTKWFSNSTGCPIWIL